MFARVLAVAVLRFDRVTRLSRCRLASRGRATSNLVPCSLTNTPSTASMAGNRCIVSSIIITHGVCKMSCPIFLPSLYMAVVDPAHIVLVDADGAGPDRAERGRGIVWLEAQAGSSVGRFERRISLAPASRGW